MLDTGLNVVGPSVATQGLIWRDHWVSDGEGPYTRLAKIAIANAEDARFLSVELLAVRPAFDPGFGEFHPRSLLTSAWFQRSARRRYSVELELAECTLNRLVGNWWRWIASDRHFRYCSDCLAAGFQSALMQVAALEICPVHHTALVAACATCGAPTPRYALDQSFDAPMACGHCGSLLSMYFRNFRHWRSTNTSSKGFGELAKRLQPLRDCRFLWPEIDRWCQRDPDHSLEYKQAVFSVLARALGLELPGCVREEKLSLRLAYFPNASAMSINASARIAIIKSVRRHLMRLVRSTLSRQPGDLAALSLDGTSSQVMATKPVPVRLHAAAAWMIRFGCWPFDAQGQRDRYARLAIPPELLRWPGGMVVTDRAWSAFAEACWSAEIASAIGWAKRLRLMRLGDGHSITALWQAYRCHAGATSRQPSDDLAVLYGFDGEAAQAPLWLAVPQAPSS